MNHQEFFNILIGKPPAEIEFEIEVKCREVNELPTCAIRAYCFSLVKENRLQDMLIIAAMQRIAETESKLMQYEIMNHHYTKNLKPKKKYKKKPKTLFDRLKAMLGMFR